MIPNNTIFTIHQCKVIRLKCRRAMNKDSRFYKLQTVWLSVIVQALRDTSSFSHRAQAINFLNGETGDFDGVANLAGLNPSYVRRIIKHVLSHKSESKAAA